MSKINIVVRLQHWMDSVPGQTFLNYAYSWGASIVILGALFKLTHLPGGNFMLFMGMGTEVVVFFLSAFDRPFDKDEIGKELPHDYETDEEIAARLGLTDDDEEADDTDEDTIEDTTADEAASQSVAAQPAAAQPAAVQPATQPAAAAAQGMSGVVFVGGGAAAAAAPSAAATSATVDGGGNAAPETAAATAAATPNAAEAAQAAIAAATPAGAQPFDAEAKRLAEIIRLANDELLRRAQAVLSPEMEEATQAYIAKLRTLADTFTKVDEQSARLAHDSEEMAQLNRTLTAINKTYDLHFQSISKQVGTIEQINEETRQLAKRIEELNGVYRRMIDAMAVNMPKQAE
ncbi:gliding motility protein GldL [Prevotellamassilia timonensis]|uniref:type IX secretion system motor protein PorL/GldL n=1 Tax=Prevotellamassilia timonensis TaxID=1852370 RepID=UPI0023F30326|nr:gliding motility protein GldL [Prevotellamassilia timonensis]MDD7440702.1 gliding motility protein GldL [Prevotellamassilia timonensis]